MDMKTKTVLIVEDNELNMKLFHDLLDAHGYNILQTKDGMEALDIAREHRPDLILMDIQLPDIDGILALRQIRQGPASSGVYAKRPTPIATANSRRRERRSP